MSPVEVVTPKNAVEEVTREVAAEVESGNGYNPFLLNPRKRVFPIVRSCLEKPSDSNTKIRLLSLLNLLTYSKLEEISRTYNV